MSHTYVRALRSAKPCLGRTFLTLCASSHHAPTRGCSCGLISCPATGSLDWCVFFTSGLLVWFRWSAPWSRSSQVPTSWSGLRAAARLSAAICSLSGGRSTRRSTSRHGLLWPMGAASVCLLHVPLVSSPAAAARAHAERCRPVHTLVGPLIWKRYVTDVTNSLGHHRFLVRCSDSFPRSL